MAELRALAHSVCVCCFAAAILRDFFPDGSLKPVINTILALYILSGLIKSGAQVDYQELLASLKLSSAASAETLDYSGYAENLLNDVIAEEGE